MLKKCFANWGLYFDPACKVGEYQLMRALEAWAHTQFTHNSNPQFNQALRKLIDAVRELRKFY